MKEMTGIPFATKISKNILHKGSGNRLGKEYTYYRILIPTEVVEALGGLQDNELVQVIISKIAKIASK
jgi:hypothetical protein